MNWIWASDKPYLQKFILGGGSGGTQPTYIGFAKPGSADDTAAWRIQELTYSGDMVIAIKWAKSGATAHDHREFNKKWSLYNTYTYE